MRIKTALLAMLTLLTFAQNTMAQETIKLDLWPGEPQHVSTDPADTAYIQVFLPNPKQATGRAVVICPGGAYQMIAISQEGVDWAPFFTSQGIAAIVVKYRLPHGNLNIPISDAEQAIRTVRYYAREWNINPDDVGIMGFSAGGHLASTVATHAASDVKPNFQILFYPVISMKPDITHHESHDNLLGRKPGTYLEELYSNDMQVSASTPRAFIMLSDDDDVVMPANSINYYSALLAHKIPAALYVYPSGGHGYGIYTSFPYHLEMLLELKGWLASF